MAEHEIVKHSVKTVKLFRGKERKGWDKFKEILLEIVIIVFAITFSLWIHNRSEKEHNQDNVKEFLKGTKEDLESDVKEMTDDENGLKQLINGAVYLKNVYLNKKASEDSLNIYARNIFFGKVQLIPNIGRYEGFKSSGQIGFIENKKLANLILDHYQENITLLIWISETQNNFIEQQLYPYINTHFVPDENFKFRNIIQPLKDPVFYNLINRYSTNSRGMLKIYEKVIKSSKKVIAEIEKENL